MKKDSIKKHLAKYRIHQKRSTTINHAFASAIAPCDLYDQEKVSAALLFLGQDPEGNLLCVFCEGRAQTWDHLVSLVSKGELRGYGHQIGNLVPCCKDCNSSKGSKDFKDFVENFSGIKSDRKALSERLENYLKMFTRPVDIHLLETRVPEQWRRYQEVKKQIVDAMKEADELADVLRTQIVE